MENNIQIAMLALVAVAALALVLQTIFLIVAASIARKAVSSLRQEFEHYRTSIAPIITRTSELIQNVAPKVEQTAGELAAISKTLRAQTAEIEIAAQEIIASTHKQVGRVDGMLTSFFDRVDQATKFMSEAVARPMRQVSGVIASVRAAVETLRSDGSRQPRATAQYPDGEPQIVRPERRY